MSDSRSPVAAHGLLLVDKPIGITSFAVVAKVRRLYNVRQVGHAGTLDPMATGLLPVLVGEGTKLTPWTMGLGKEYRATVRFGAATDSYDAEGRVTHTADPAALALVDEPRLRQALVQFTGTIRQRPPAFSAIKRDGQRLYDVARRTAAAGGDVEAIEVDEREVTIEELELESFAHPDAVLRVRCSKGTYIRSLAHDLGVALDSWAHLIALRRLRIGPFDLAEAVRLDEQRPEAPPALLPLARVVSHLPSVTIDADVERRLRLGQQGALADITAPPGELPALCLLDERGQLVAILEPSTGGHRFQLARVFHTAPGPVA